MSMRINPYKQAAIAKNKARANIAAEAEMEGRAVLMPDHLLTADERRAEADERLGTTTLSLYARRLPRHLIQFVEDEGLTDADLETLNSVVNTWQGERRALKWKISRVLATLVEIQTLAGGNVDRIYDLNWAGISRSILVEMASMGRVFTQEQEYPDRSWSWYAALYRLAKHQEQIHKPKTPKQWNQLKAACAFLFNHHANLTTSQLQTILTAHQDAEGSGKPPLFTVTTTTTTTTVTEADDDEQATFSFDTDEDVPEDDTTPPAASTYPAAPQAIGDPLSTMLLIPDDGGNPRYVEDDGTVGGRISWTDMMRQTGLRGKVIRLTIEEVDVQPIREVRFDGDY